METKIILELTENKANINFEPALNESESFVAYFNNALNTMPNALLNILTMVPILRPACTREQEVYTYVFNEGERGEIENNLYKYRKHLYDSIASVFSELLFTAFPDIEYIEKCKQYQQEFCMSHNEEDVKEYTELVSEVVDYVRSNFEEVLKEVMEQQEEVLKEDMNHDEEEKPVSE